MNEPKNNKRKHYNEMPVVDEGWWESVLADEQKYSAVYAKPVLPVAAPQEKLASEAKPEPLDWDTIKRLYKNDHILEMQVVGHNRGGLLVEGNGLAGFVPLSHLIELTGKEMDKERLQSLEGYIGRTLKVKVIECVPEDERIIFSERAALAEPGKRVELFHTLSPGMRIVGKVTNITDFGVFVDLGGVEGLIHISELSWGRVTHPSHLVKLGEEIEVEVLDLSAERCRVALSRKRLLPNPWERAAEDFPQGKIVSATVTNVLSYGAFASLDIGVEGLIHATQMPLAEGQSPRDLLTVGQRLQLRVLHVDPAHQRLGFSMMLDSQ
ncbi:MAG: S1 RNA-binding domain-containing protein [Chloroflexota bacterium]